MDIKDLTPEQKAKAMECASSEELAALAQKYGIDLTNEQLNAIAGGEEWYECGGFDSW